MYLQFGNKKQTYDWILKHSVYHIQSSQFFSLLVEPKVVRNEVKTWFLLRKPFVLFYCKNSIQFCCHTSTLISFPAARAAVTSCISSWAFNNCRFLHSSQLRKLSDFVKLRMTQNVLNWSFSYGSASLHEVEILALSKLLDFQIELILTETITISFFQ